MFPTGLQGPPGAFLILPPSHNVPSATAPMKTDLLPPSVAGTHREKEVSLLQCSSLGVHGHGLVGNEDGAGRLVNISGVGSKPVVGYESVWERDMFAEALWYPLNRLGLLLPVG